MAFRHLQPLREEGAATGEGLEQRVDVVLGVVEVRRHAQVLVAQRARDRASASDATSAGASVERTQTSGPRRAGSAGVTTEAPSSSRPSISLVLSAATWASTAGTPVSWSNPRPATPA